MYVIFNFVLYVVPVQPHTQDGDKSQEGKLALQGIFS